MKDQHNKKLAHSKGEVVIITLIIIVVAIVVSWTIYVNHLYNKSVQLIKEANSASADSSARTYAEAASIIEKVEKINLNFQLSKRELSAMYTDIANGLLNSKQADFALCKKLCSKALSMNDNPDLRIKFATAFAQRKEYAEAIAQLDKYLEKDSDGEWVRKLRRTWKRQQLLESAIKMADKGDRLLDGGKLDEAIAQYRKTIERYPEFNFVKIGIAGAYIKKFDSLSNEEQKDDSKKFLDKAVDAVEEIIKSKYPQEKLLQDISSIKQSEPHYKLAVIYTALEMFDKAVAECKKHTAKNPGDKRVKKLMEIIEKTRKIKETLPTDR